MKRILDTWGAILVAILILLASCRTVKHIDRVEYKTDSMAVRQRDSVIAVYKQDSAAYTAMIASLSNNTVIFQDTGSTRIEYYPDGSLKSVEGKVRSLSASLAREARESAYWKSKYDSSASHSSKDSIQVKTQYVTIKKDIKRTVFPWYFWLLLIPALLAGYYIKKRLS